MLRRIKKKVREIRRTWVSLIIQEKDKKPDVLSEVKVGEFIIKIPTGSPLAGAYQSIPSIQNCLINAVKIARESFPNIIAIDVGANIGDTLALIKTASDIPVICVEGDTFCAQVLSENAKLFSNVEIIKTFLGEIDGMQAVSIHKKTWNATLIPTGDVGAEEINFTTLDSLLLNEERRSDAKILKVDCEGYDLRILRGADQFIREVRPIILFEYNQENLNDLEEEGQRIFQWLETRGYQRLFIFDHVSRFLFEVSDKNWETIADLSDYLLCKENCLCYVDIVAFPNELTVEADKFAKLSRLFRSSLPKAGQKSAPTVISQ